LTCTVTHVFANDAFPNVCQNQKFKNTYYLIDNKDIAAVSTFIRGISRDVPFKEPRLIIYDGELTRSITYYDFDNLELLNTNKELMHVFNESLPENRVEKEEIIFSDRGELTEGMKSFTVRSYNKKLTPFDKHSLFGRVKRKERPILFEMLSTVNIEKPELISESLKLKSIENVNLVTHFGIPYGAVTLSLFSVVDFGMPNTSFLLKFEIFSNKENILTAHEESSLNMFFCQADKLFQLYFPHIKSSSWFGYAEYHKLATTILPSRASFREYPILFSIGQIVCLSMIGFLFIYLVLGRYSKRNDFRKVAKSEFKGNL